MFCPTCGAQNADSAHFCCQCGSAMAAAPGAQTAPTSMGFGQAIASCFGHYADFNGSASRAEYWWFYLFCLLLGWGALLVDHSGTLAAVVNLALLLPSLAVAARVCTTPAAAAGGCCWPSPSSG